MGLFDKKSKFAIKKDFKLSEESALDSVMVLLQKYDFDIDGELDEETKKLKESVAESLLEYFRLGHLELADDNVTIIQNLKEPVGDGTQIKYPEPRGRNKRVMDKFKQNELYGRAFALLGSVSGLSMDVFDALKKYDNKVAETVGLLFLL